ncbi:hypothetical protein MOBT1_001781 [Malassezia obtusa]|uniref:PDZ GRASP-type domain-containing protein n=1 Tax=Malassezia obtusa TaxID=76774 RepID=A0AAF0IS25_9BASI|nr:hypothetical protein MOBT1_001781 [Malassezia obtusa]
MGATESRPEAGVPSIGYHVIRVAQGSPAHHAGFEPFFDFCIGINGLPLTDLGVEYPPGVPIRSRLGSAKWSTVEANEGREIVLNVWNTKQQAYRDNAQPSLLGLTLRLCNPNVCISHVWHILDVLEGSPADSAGLVPFGDYIIGWTGGPLESENDFFQLIEQHAGRNVAMYVYNSDYDHTREVVIMPNRDWGGEGLLGCGVGYGLLHRIPKPQRSWEQDEDLAPPQTPGAPAAAEPYGTAKEEE